MNIFATIKNVVAGRSESSAPPQSTTPAIPSAENKAVPTAAEPPAPPLPTSAVNAAPSLPGTPTAPPELTRAGPPDTRSEFQREQAEHLLQRRRRRDEAYELGQKQAEQHFANENAKATQDPGTLPFDEKFRRPDYGLGCLEDFGGLPPPLLASLISSDPALPGFIAEQAKAIEPEMVKFERCEFELGKLNITSARALMRKITAENFAAAERGDLDAIKPLPNASLEEERIRHARSIWREAEKTASAACDPAFRAIGERLQAAARLLADKLDRQERKGAAELGIKFKPSETVRRFALAGFYFQNWIKFAYSPAARSSPRHFMQQFLPADPKP